MIVGIYLFQLKTENHILNAKLGAVKNLIFSFFYLIHRVKRVGFNFYKTKETAF